MMSVRSSAESPSVTCAARDGSSFSRIAPRRVIVGWSNNSTTRATGSIITTVEASISFNWLSNSTRSSGGRSATCSLMPTKLSSRRRLIRSRKSSSVVIHLPPFHRMGLTGRRGDRATGRWGDRLFSPRRPVPPSPRLCSLPSLLPLSLQVIQQSDETQVTAQVVQAGVVGEEGVIFVAELNGPSNPFDRLVAHVLHSVKRRQPERHVMIRGGDLFYVIGDQGPGAIMILMRAVTPTQNDLQRVEVGVLIERFLGQLPAFFNAPLVEIDQREKGLDQRVVGFDRAPFFEFRYGPVVFVAVGVYPPAVVAGDDDVARVEFEQPFILPERLVVEAVQAIEHPGDDEDGRVVRRLPPHLGQRRQSLLLLAAVQVDVDHLQTRPRQVFVQFERAQQRRFREAKILAPAVPLALVHD